MGLLSIYWRVRWPYWNIADSFYRFARKHQVETFTNFVQRRKVYQLAPRSGLGVD